MRHICVVSKTVAPASTGGLCGQIGSDRQARLCFILSLLTSFVLPIVQLKNPQPDNGTSN
jgi:hypothetical protein